MTWSAEILSLIQEKTDETILITVAQFCRCVGVGRTTAHPLIRDQEVATLIGRRRLISVQSVETLTGQTFSPEEEPMGRLTSLTCLPIVWVILPHSLRAEAESRLSQVLQRGIVSELA